MSVWLCFFGLSPQADDFLVIFVSVVREVIWGILILNMLCWLKTFTVQPHQFPTEIPPREIKEKENSKQQKPRLSVNGLSESQRTFHLLNIRKPHCRLPSETDPQEIKQCWCPRAGGNTVFFTSIACSILFLWFSQVRNLYYYVLTKFPC